MANQPVIPAAQSKPPLAGVLGELLRGAKRSLALFEAGYCLGQLLQPQLWRRPAGATGVGSEGGRGTGTPGRAPRVSQWARASPEAPGEPGPSGRLPLSAMPPPGARDHPVAAFGSTPYKDWQGGHVRPGPPAGRGSWGRGGRREERGGSRGRRQERGADSAAVGGGGGGGSGSRALTAAPGSGTQAAAEAAAEEGTSAGAGERGGSQRAREGR